MVDSKEQNDKEIAEAKEIGELLSGVMFASSEFTYNDAKELKELMENKALRKALHQLLRVSDTNLDLYRRADLATEQGIREAVKFQAKANSFSEAVDFLIELTQIKEESHATE